MGSRILTLRVKLVLALVVVAAIAISGWLVWGPPKARATDSSFMNVQSLNGPPIEGVTISAPDFSDDSLSGIEQTLLDVPTMMGLDLLMSLPVEIELDQPLPSEGVILKRQFAEPLPQGVIINFHYFDEDLLTWLPVPTVISSDRLSISATVHHFSLWTTLLAGSKEVVGKVKSAGKQVTQAVGNAYDFVRQGAQAAATEVGNFIVGAPDWSYYAAGAVLGTRIEQPECKNPPPEWLDHAIYIEDHKNNPIRFCTGATDTGNLVIKASVNRSYAFPYIANIDSLKVENSADSFSLDNIKDAVLHVDAAITKSLTTLFSAQGIVSPGETLTVTYSRDAIAGATDPLALSLTQPDLPTFLVSMSTSMLVNTGLSINDSALIATLSIGQCADDILLSSNLGDAAAGIASCLMNQSESISKLVAGSLVGAGATRANAVRVSRGIGVVSLWALLVSASSAGIDYVAQSQTSDASLQVRAYAKFDAAKSKTYSTTIVDAPISFQHPDSWKVSKSVSSSGFEGEIKIKNRTGKLMATMQMITLWDGYCSTDDACVEQPVQNFESTQGETPLSSGARFKVRNLARDTDLAPEFSSLFGPTKRIEFMMTIAPEELPEAAREMPIAFPQILLLDPGVEAFPGQTGYTERVMYFWGEREFDTMNEAKNYARSEEYQQMQRMITSFRG